MKCEFCNKLILPFNKSIQIGYNIFVCSDECNYEWEQDQTEHTAYCKNNDNWWCD